jgi:hypothetical protein
MKRSAWCFVTVEWREKAPSDPAPPQSLCLSTSRTPGGGILLARVGVEDARRAMVLDEHLAVDADACRDRRRLECADVVYGSLPRPLAEAVRWLADIRAASAGCCLAAVPLIDGGWAAAGGKGPGTVVLACLVPPEQWLFVSCLHAWLVTGLRLSELEAAYPQVKVLSASP